MKWLTFILVLLIGWYTYDGLMTLQAEIKEVSRVQSEMYQQLLYEISDTRSQLHEHKALPFN